MKPLIYRPPQDPLLDIIYSDDDILVLNKPAGLLSVPGKDPAHRDCLESRAQSALPGALTVHRLDMDTSGVMVMGRSVDAHRYLSRGFQDRKTAKEYIACVMGHMKDDSGTVDKPLRCDWPNRPKQMVDMAEGRTAVTHWKVIERSDDGYTRVSLTPITGRTHQLRVHMLALGHPILGDRFYGDMADCDGVSVESRAPRLMLHALKLSFLHPRTQERVCFSADVPF